ncbi:unnamed protein product [Meloidogyne enterolobii]|uniref:Uncharacterized protein n=1 Tax=Meloidogyne enterolobii TaxID=390850 RepID=A0ACB0XWK8_MELEN
MNVGLVGRTFNTTLAFLSVMLSLRKSIMFGTLTTRAVDLSSTYTQHSVHFDILPFPPTKQQHLRKFLVEIKRGRMYRIKRRGFW